MSESERDRQERRLADFTAHRPYLFAIAYRMLGVAEDAEDVLQDAWLRYAASRAEEVENPRAFLVTIVTRLSLDLLRAARRTREEYVGAWLPEPVFTEEALPEELAERADSASFAFLLLVERLTPLERVVLVLHDIFDYPHPEIARMTGRTAAASRQVLRRARQRLGERPRTPQPRDEHRLAEFVAATREGDIDRLMRLLAPDVVLISDGGGKAQAINRPLAGATVVARFLASMARLEPDARGRFVSLNGQPALLAGDRMGPVHTVYVFDTSPAGITAIYVIRNPDKLRRFEGVTL